MASPLDSLQRMTPKRRITLFAVFTVLVAILFRAPLLELLQFSIEDPYQSHLLIIPLISLFLVCTQRERIFGNGWTGSRYGYVLLGLGLVIRVLALELLPNPTEDGRLSLAILSFVLLFAGGFVFFFGAKTARAVAAGPTPARRPRGGRGAGRCPPAPGRARVAGVPRCGSPRGFVGRRFRA